MKKESKIGEYKAILFVIGIIIIFTTIATVTFNKLNEVSDNISEAIKVQPEASAIAKQIILELRVAEKNAKAYSLSKDEESIKEFKKSEDVINEYINQINDIKIGTEVNKKLIDSVVYHTYRCYDIINLQALQTGSDSIVKELDELSDRVEKIYFQSTINKDSSLKAEDTIHKKKGFFKRLFSKKQKEEPQIAIKFPDKKKDVKTNIKKEIKKTKNTQENLLSIINQQELILAKIYYYEREKLNLLADTLKEQEKRRAFTKAKTAETEINKLRRFSLYTSIFITITLLLMIFFIWRYIRKKHQYETALLDSKQQAEKLAAAKETFLANMSHEIKTPLNAILGFSDQLSRGELNEEQRQHVGIIKSASLYLTKIVNNILTYSRLNSGKVIINKTNINLKEELFDLKFLLSKQVSENGNSIEIDTSELYTEYLKLDIDKLKQVLINIIGNATKFTKNGKITVKAAEIEREGDKCLVLIISDTGKGIAQENIERIYQEFEQEDESTNIHYGGTGLGLAITKQILDKMNGEIDIASEKDKGTVVTIVMPVEVGIENTEIQQDENNEDVEMVSLSGMKILIADDEEYNRLLLKSILRKTNSQISEAQDGNEAVWQVKNNTFDLVIMDVRMPNKNGIDATLEIRKFNQTIPIIGATAVSSEEKLSKCLNSGMNEILFKPFTAKEFAIKINSVMKKESGKLSTETFITKSISLNSLNVVIGEDAELRKELMAVFKKSIFSADEELRVCYEKKDLKRVSEIAHKLIPSCKHFEANKLVELLKYFEDMKIINSSNRDQIDKQFENLFARMNEVKEDIEKLTASNHD